MATVLVVPDLHCPHEHPKALLFLDSLAREHRADKVVFLGDEVDFASFSRFPKDPDAQSPGDELNSAIESLMPFFRAFPKAYVCESNHTDRIYKRAFEAGLPRRTIVNQRQLLKAPAGWQWKFEWVIDGVHYRHGDGLSGDTAAKLASERYGVPVVFGHLHGLHQIHRTLVDGGKRWSMAVGCLINPKSPAFSYAKHSHRKPVLGAAIVKDGNPQWFPLEV